MKQEEGKEKKKQANQDSDAEEAGARGLLDLEAPTRPSAERAKAERELDEAILENDGEAVQAAIDKLQRIDEASRP